MRSSGRGWIGAMIASLIWFGLGCQKAIKPPNADLFLPEAVKRVLVLPFSNMTTIYGENTSIRSPLSGKVFYTGAVKKGSEEMLTNKLVSILDQKGEFHLIPPEQAEGLILDSAGFASRDDAVRYRVQEIGRQLSADAVLVGHLYRCKERIGTKYAADTPASVAFDLSLVSVTDGRLLWSGNFDETQKALNENLFLLGSFLKRKGSWVTAEEMAVTGLTNLLEKLPENPGKGR
jgi:hypothetical protein